MTLTANISNPGMKRILVYRLGSLGDTIVALPSLHLVAQKFPEAERWMLTNFSDSLKEVPMRQLLKDTGLIHKYIQYPVRLRNPAAIVELSKSIRSIRPEIMVYLAEPRGLIRIIRDVVFFKLCGIRKIIGVPFTKKMQRPAYLGDGTYEYVGTRLLRCIQPLGTLDLKASSAFDLSIGPIEHNSAEKKIHKLGVNRPFITASVGAKVDVKDWGDDNWTSLLSRLGKQLNGWGLAMVGSSNERERTSKLLKKWPGKVLNLCDRMSIRESAAVLSRSRAYIGHDSGPMHLASAVHTPCVAIFSSRNLPGEWFPPGVRNQICYRTISCMGCRRSVCEDRRKMCIRSISVNDVFDHVVQVLDMARPFPDVLTVYGN